MGVLFASAILWLDCDFLCLRVQCANICFAVVVDATQLNSIDVEMIYMTYVFWPLFLYYIYILLLRAKR